MKRYDKITPEGTRDLLFAECASRKQAEATLDAVFESAGYHQVITPGFEFYDVFAASERYFPQEDMFKLMDDKGRILVARPDSTIPIARLVSTRLKGYPLPLRLYYAQSIFRKQPLLRGRNNEVFQMGIELLGDDSFASDIEVLSLGASALSAFPATSLRLEIGHVGVFRLLMEHLDADDEQKARIHSFISAKNYGALSAKLDRLADTHTARILRELPRLFGGSEVFEKARRLFDGYDPRLTDMLRYLCSVYEALARNGLEDRIIIDFGLVNQADYYSSLVFKGYLDSVGEPVLSGGRYDRLLADFGEGMAATGFGINVDILAAESLRRNGKDLANQKDPHLRIALTKGRLEKSAVELFQAMGLDCRPLHEKGRKLFIRLPGTDIEVVFAKAADVITYVEHGVCDLGIVGMDTILESGGTFYEVLNLGFGECRFVLAAAGGTSFYSGYGTKRIATKYPKVARDFFEEKGMDVQVIRIEGSVELAPILGLADGIVDIVETGSTLRENGLEVVEEIRRLSARLIVNEASMKLKKNGIDRLIEAMEKAVQRCG